MARNLREQIIFLVLLHQLTLKFPETFAFSQAFENLEQNIDDVFAVGSFNEPPPTSPQGIVLPSYNAINMEENTRKHDTLTKK